MRRIASLVLVLAAALSSCSSPAIRLATRFAAGERRTYHLVSEVSTRADVPAVHTAERTRLVGTATVEVTASDASGFTITVTITPKSFTRNGKVAVLPPAQAALLDVSPEGAVKRVVASGTTPVALGGQTDDLATLIGSPAARGRVRVADRWRSSLEGDAGAGAQSGRVAALRYEAGYRCAEVDIATRRPASRQQQVQGRPVALDGTEVAATRIAFAIDDGFPVRITGDGEGRFGVAGVTAGPSAVVIVTHTEILLTGRSVRSQV